MSFGKLLLILSLVTLKPSPAVLGQSLYYDPFGNVVGVPYGFGLGTSAVLDDIRGAQMALRNRGFYFGDFHGVLTEETVDAIRRFQAASYLDVTGYLDPRTQWALGITIKGTATTTAAYGYFTPNPPGVPWQQYRTEEPWRPEISGEPVRPMPGTTRPAPEEAPPISVILSDENRSDLRTALADKGFDPGPGDRMDSQWVRAIVRFQSEYGIPISGVLDEATLSALDLRFDIFCRRHGSMRVWRSGRYPAGADSTPHKQR
jgi:peptidoglycan hydrolase-like protein with peptidoglycan-binding domain